MAQSIYAEVAKVGIGKIEPESAFEVFDLFGKFVSFQSGD